MGQKDGTSNSSVWTSVWTQGAVVAAIIVASVTVATLILNRLVFEKGERKALQEERVELAKLNLELTKAIEQYRQDLNTPEIQYIVEAERISPLPLLFNIDLQTGKARPRSDLGQPTISRKTMVRIRNVGRVTAEKVRVTVKTTTGVIQEAQFEFPFEKTPVRVAADKKGVDAEIPALFSDQEAQVNLVTTMEVRQISAERWPISIADPTTSTVWSLDTNKLRAFSSSLSDSPELTVEVSCWKCTSGARETSSP